MITSRFLTGIATLVVGGAIALAVAPSFSLQAPVQATEHHERILEGVGMWEGEFSMWMPGMADPMKTTCTEQVFGLGDLWTFTHFEMELMGQSFTGSATLGYDPEAKKYIGTWIDSSTATMTQMEGTWDAEKKAIVMTFEGIDQATGAMVPMRSEVVSDGKSMVSTFYQVGEDGDRKQMEMRMTRKATVEAGADK